MGIITILSSKESRIGCTNSLNINDLDPTGVMRLHSILTGLDIFELTLKYNYNPRPCSDMRYELQIPDKLRLMITDIKENDIKELAGLWNQSREIQLYGWSLKQTEQNIRLLIDFCSHETTSLLIYIEIQYR